MSDLISRSELINVLKVHFDSCFREDGELLYSDHICTSDDVVDLIKLVENQPTSYDIDKVVKELETIKDRYDHSCIDNAYQRGVKAGAQWLKKKAIEIVKQGGVYDDACEWERDGHSENDNPAEWIICPHNPKRIYSKDIKYCPYCGNKIKVVE